MSPNMVNIEIIRPMTHKSSALHNSVEMKRSDLKIQDIRVDVTVIVFKRYQNRFLTHDARTECTIDNLEPPNCLKNRRSWERKKWIKCDIPIFLTILQFLITYFWHK